MTRLEIDWPPLLEEVNAGAAEPALVFRDVATLIGEVDSAEPPVFLFEPVWPSDAYGVVAAEDKAGKTWAVIDAAVSVASGTPWLTAFPCPGRGPVLLLVGEGGGRNLARRLRAVASARGLDAAALPIRVCLRVPHLTREDHLALLAAELTAHPPRLVILDPLYLAARGTSGSDLYAMGEALEGLQHLCQQASAALSVVTHFNKTGEGRGAARITGVGPGAWGRVLATAHVEHRSTDEAGASTVVLSWQFIGGEIPDTTLRLRRRVWAEDPADLGSPLHYAVEVVEDDEAGPVEGAGLRPSAARVRAVLAAATEPLTVKLIGDRLAAAGRPLKRRTIQQALTDLGDDVDEFPVDGRTSAWSLPGEPS